MNNVDYKIQLANKVRMFHLNVLKLYDERDVTNLYDCTTPVVEFIELDVVANCEGLAAINKAILWNEDLSNTNLPIVDSEHKEFYLDVVYGNQLDASQLSQMKDLVYEFRYIFRYTRED